MANFFFFNFLESILISSQCWLFTIWICSNLCFLTKIEVTVNLVMSNFEREVKKENENKMASSLLKLQQTIGWVKHSLPLIPENQLQGASVMYYAPNALWHSIPTCHCLIQWIFFSQLLQEQAKDLFHPLLDSSSSGWKPVASKTNISGIQISHYSWSSMCCIYKSSFSKFIIHVLKS